MNSADERQVLLDKRVFFAHCSAAGIPTIPVLCVITGEAAARGDALNVDVDGWCRAQGVFPRRVFVKLIDGSWGIDAFAAERTGNIWQYCDRQGDAAEFYRFCQQRLRDRSAWIVQPVIDVHRDLRPIMSPRGLGTLRMVTVQGQNGPYLALSVLRITVGDNCTDNFSHGRSGNLVAPVDLATGRVGTAVGSRSREWPLLESVPFHPDTGEAIGGWQLPMWAEAKQLVVRAHASFRGLVTVGWDVAITDSGPLIVEANGSYDVDLLQAAFRRGVKADLPIEQHAH